MRREGVDAGQARTGFNPGATPGVYKLDLLTGEVLWEVHPTHLFEGQDVPSAFSAAVSVTNDVVFADQSPITSSGNTP